jgi:hypothetical protein
VEEPKRLGLGFVTGVAAGLWIQFVGATFKKTYRRESMEGLTDVGIIFQLWSGPGINVERMAWHADIVSESLPVGAEITSVEPDWARVVAHPKLPELESATVATLKSYPKGHAARLRLIDEWCTFALLVGDQAILDRSLPWSAELYEAKSAEWTVVGTHGSVLVATGRTTEGVVLLEMMMTNDQVPLNRAFGACCLAWVAHGRGDTATRDRWWAEALRCNDGRPRIPWMAQEMGLGTTV